MDSPFSQNVNRNELDLFFPLISGVNREIIDEYDVSVSLLEYGIENLANRAVFVIDEDRQITYAWIADDPKNEPDYDEVEDPVEAVA